MLFSAERMDAWFQAFLHLLFAPEFKERSLLR